jgi:hypothetical protein
MHLFPPKWGVPEAFRLGSYLINPLLQDMSNWWWKNSEQIHIAQINY